MSSITASPGYSLRRIFRKVRVRGKSLASRTLPSTELSKLTQLLPSPSQLQLCRPGLRHGPVPLKRDVADSRTGIDRFFLRWVSNKHHYGASRTKEWATGLTNLVAEIEVLSEPERESRFTENLHTLRQNQQNLELLDIALAHACVSAREVLGLSPRLNQMIAARLMLRGVSVEMATGEGKTLAIALAACVVALTGTPLHVLTANDYLAERDVNFLRPFYEAFGLTVSSSLSSSELENRKAAYQSDIVYVTGKQVAFDWLSDAMSSGVSVESLASRLGDLAKTPSESGQNSKMLRGLCMAIVDEADSLLVDEARTPLVLAAAHHVNSIDDTEATIALGLAEQLMEGVHYIVDFRERSITLTDDGKEELRQLAEKVSQVWKSSRYRNERVVQSLTAIRLYKLDRDYIVRDGSVELLDAQTGRAMPDRRLQFGLHQLLEVKERCAATPDHTTIASIPFQHFFNRYIDLVGISGTLLEVQEEIHHIYGLEVVQVPSHLPSDRYDAPTIVYTEEETQIAAAVSEIKAKNSVGQPVLVCTRSVEQSNSMSEALHEAGLEHSVLNAYQDSEEAGIVSMAGRLGQITVATNMAGRGTDIPLGDGSADRGGLHVLSMGFNDARRIDRQLLGRSSRQGDPGSTQTMLSIEDPYLQDAMSPILKSLIKKALKHGRQKMASDFIRVTQRLIEKRHRKERVVMYKSRKKIDRYLAFGGQQEHLL